MKKYTIFVLSLLIITGCASSLETGKDGFSHFKTGEKFDHHRTEYDGGLVGDLYLETDEIYHAVEILDLADYPFIKSRGAAAAITLNNGIMLLDSAYGNYGKKIVYQAKILFPNGWMVATNTDVATHFSASEHKFMFEGDVLTGILAPDTSDKWSADTKRGREQVKATLASMFPDKRINYQSTSKISYLTTLKWPTGNFYYVKTRLKTSAPLNQWPMTLSRTKGLNPGYYGLEKDGSPFGFGSFLHDDGVLTIGNFKDGTLEGVAEQLLTDGSSLKGTYVKGYKNGLFSQLLPIAKNGQQVADRIESEKPLSLKERKRAQKMAAKALKNGATRAPVVTKVLPGTIQWQGLYEQDIQTGWWQKTLNNRVVELRLFDEGMEVDVVSLEHSSACSLHSIDGEIMQFSSSNSSCNGALFSAKTGTLYQDVVTDGNMIIEAIVTPVYPKTFEGRISSGTFTGRQFNTDGGIEYVGEMADGKKSGYAKCNFEGGLEPCQFSKGVRIDTLYLARVTTNEIQQWNDECDSNISSMKSTNWQLYNSESSCTVKIFKSRFDQAYARDQADGVEWDESAVEVLGPVSEAQKCIDGARRSYDSVLKKVSTNASHLRANQCLDNLPISKMSQSIKRGVEFKRKQLSAFQTYVSKYRTYGESLERARKRSLRQFKAQVARDTYSDIVSSLSSIQTNVNKAMKISNNEFNSIMRTYEINKPKQISQYQKFNLAKVDKSHSNVNSSTVNAGSSKIVSPRRADQLLAAYKKKCLSDPANSWRNNGCVYTVPYDGRFNCSDSTGLTCKTGDAWNRNNADPKQLTAAHSGATSFSSASNDAEKNTVTPSGKKSIPLRVKEDKGESMPDKYSATTMLASQLYNKAHDLCHTKHNGRLAQFISGKAYASGSHGPFTCNIVRNDWYQCSGELTIDCKLP